MVNMRYKLICCDVFSREMYDALLKSSDNVFPVFTMKMSHEYPDRLRELIQKEIDNTDPDIFSHILLGYGLCGNAIAGLKTGRIPVVIPRAHDCCTIFLGSKQSFKKHFGHRPSCRWTSGGYMQDGDYYLRKSEVHQFLGIDMSFEELAEKYGEENARYIIETLAPKDDSDKQVVFIETPPYEKFDLKKRAETEAEKDGRSFESIQGDTRLLEMLVNGDWNEEDFLIVPPYHMIEGVYDSDIIVKAVPAGNPDE